MDIGLAEPRKNLCSLLITIMQIQTFEPHSKISKIRRSFQGITFILLSYFMKDEFNYSTNSHLYIIICPCHSEIFSLHEELYVLANVIHKMVLI